jgi:hypothetical protein
MTHQNVTYYTMNCQIEREAQTVDLWPHAVKARSSKATHKKKGKIRSRVGTAFQLVRLLVGNGRWWLIPFLGVLALTSILLAAVTVFEYIAPFVYTIF